MSYIEFISIHRNKLLQTDIVVSDKIANLGREFQFSESGKVLNGRH